MKPHLLAALAAAMIAAAPPVPGLPPAPAPATPPSAEEHGTAMGFEADQTQRMTVPVNVDGTGPYRFIVDTGAERTVIARELATRLALGSAGMVRVHSMTEVSDIATVLIPALRVGGNELHDIHAPALERRNLGAEGMLGIDALQSQRVSFDFRRDEMTIVSSRRMEERWDGEAIVVTGRSRFGQLVLVDASVEGQKVWVIIDTGAQLSVGNLALRHRLERHRRLKEVHPVEMLSVTGGRATADATTIHSIQLGGVNILDLPIAFADVHPFRQLGLLDRPAILLGMDALRLFDRVSVDFANRRVRLLPASHSMQDFGNRMAGINGESPGS
jgi:predicted aspartyl protease